jgi:hypothetical protein
MSYNKSGCGDTQPAERATRHLGNSYRRITIRPAGFLVRALKLVPAKWNPVRNGEPLFADKDMRQLWNLRRFPSIWDHQVI